MTLTHLTTTQPPSIFETIIWKIIEMMMMMMMMIIIIIITTSTTTTTTIKLLLNMPSLPPLSLGFPLRTAIWLPSSEATAINPPCGEADDGASDETRNIWSVLRRKHRNRLIYIRDIRKERKSANKGIFFLELLQILDQVTNVFDFDSTEWKTNIINERK